MESEILNQLDWIESTSIFKKFMEDRKGKQPSALWDEVDALAAQMLDVALKLKEHPTLSESLWVLGITIASQDVDLLHPITSTAHNLLHLLWDQMREDGLSTVHPIPSLKEVMGLTSSPVPKKETYH